MRRSVLLLPVLALFMALSGFDCASTQMTTAKVALQRKDYAAAATALEKEVKERPNNAEAWYTLGEVYEQQMRIADAARANERARAGTEPKLSPEMMQNTYLRQFNLWRSTYNRALAAYRNAPMLVDPRDREAPYDSIPDVSRALAILDTAQIVGPEYSENLYFRATLYEEAGDEANTARTYQQYVDQMAPFVEQGSKLGLTLQMTQAQVEAKLGKPTRAEISDTMGGFYFYQPQNVYVYFAPATTKRPTVVEGWRSFDASVPEALRAAPTIIRADPYAVLGLDARNRKEYDRALEYLQTLSRLDPAREGVSSTITQIYIDTKRVDEAIASLRAEIAANPSDARPLIELGNLYFGAERFAEATESFRRVTTMNLAADDQNLRTALFNLGAVYKNLGARLQDSIKRVSNGKPTKAQNEVYFKPLRESVTFFEQYSKSNPSDYAAAVELANLYYVLDDTANRDRIVRHLETLQSANAGDRSYWRAMSKLYAILGDATKAEAADRKASAIGN